MDVFAKDNRKFMASIPSNTRNRRNTRSAKEKAVALCRCHGGFEQSPCCSALEVLLKVSLSMDSLLLYGSLGHLHNTDLRRPQFYKFAEII
jgi:hypothetical protein